MTRKDYILIADVLREASYLADSQVPITAAYVARLLRGSLPLPPEHPRALLAELATCCARVALPPDFQE